MAALRLRFAAAPPAACCHLWQDPLLWLVDTRRVLFVPFRIHDGMWRSTGVSTLRNITLAVATTSAAFLFIETLPRSLAIWKHLTELPKPPNPPSRRLQGTARSRGAPGLSGAPWAVRS